MKPYLITEPALRRLELTITRRLDGLLQGEHLGLVPGPGSEPAETRPYQVGDDVRRMDWNVTARTNEPHVRDLVADRELEIWALLDATASMDFGTAAMEKRELALSALAAIGFLTQRTGNRIGTHMLHGGGVRTLPARTGRPHLMAVLQAAFALPRTPPGVAEPLLGVAAEQLGRVVRRRGLMVVVSDFLDAPETWELPLRKLTARHQVLAVEVLDPRELTLPDVGILTLIDPETGRRREVSTSSARLRRRYAEAAAGQRDAIAQAMRRAGATHLRLRTDRDWVRDLVKHVMRQRRLAALAASPAFPAGVTGSGSTGSGLMGSGAAGPSPTGPNAGGPNAGGPNAAGPVRGGPPEGGDAA
ncbi:DUF58 domain-containing protein [Nonomuraea sp. SYSU D8015]|uniref:DUF58 domain-containing protein n=1 Tax=Nonomuraea sp. SYSU D8015 TaxID=2593644 RepID=UPI001CB73737|nr:DUF58 domain-containing protein [Nonomuraea sp. SYSU D8015]